MSQVLVLVFSLRKKNSICLLSWREYKNFSIAFSRKKVEEIMSKHLASFPRNRYVLASEEAVDRRRPSSSSTLLCYSSILRTPQTMLPKTLRNAVERSKPRSFLEAGVFFLTTIVRYYYFFFDGFLLWVWGRAFHQYSYGGHWKQICTIIATD